MDSSPRRAVRRAICRFATLTHAIRSTNDTAPTRISSSVRTDSVPYACKLAVRASMRAPATNRPACDRAPGVEIDGSFTSDVSSASARSLVAPDVMRPSRTRNALVPGSPGHRLGRKMSAAGSAPIRITGLKLKSAGITPTMVRGRPSMVRDCPTIAGSALNDVRHSRSLTIALWSSSAAASPVRPKERAAACGTDAQRGEEIRADLERGHLLRLAASGELRVDRVVGGETLERGGARAQPLVRDGRPGPEHLDADRGLLRRRDHDEPIGIGIGQRTPEHAVGDGEDRGVEADAERERGEGGQA